MLSVQLYNIWLQTVSFDPCEATAASFFKGRAKFYLVHGRKAFHRCDRFCTKEHLERPRLRAGEHSKASHCTRTYATRTPDVQQKRNGICCGVEIRVYRIVFFLQPAVKVNGDYYREVLLKEKLLPCIKEISGDNFLFQQDSAPAHRARDTIALLRRETPDFISPDQWPPNSPDMKLW